MADEYDADIVHQLLEEVISQMRIKQHKFGSRICSLVRELHDLIGDEGAEALGSSMRSPMIPPAGGISSPPTGGDAGRGKIVISSRACVVCGRDDRPGQQRSKGFKCTECVGLPSKLDLYSIQFEEMKSLDKRVNTEGEKVINEFAFLNFLGRGAYGKVKLAVHTKSDQKYAAKILNKQALQKVHKAGTQQTAMDAVRTEIQILKGLNHPNVIKMYTLIDDPSETKLYLIMEFLEGGQVYHINNDGTPTEPIDTERLKKYIVGIARGLQYLHQRNIVHRDIKPENILLDQHDNVKLTDFGVSTSCTDEDDTMTRTEGSPAYFPPEEFEHKPVKGKMHDIWSFGITVYAMAFGYLPFRANSLPDLGEAIVHTEPVYPADANPLLVDLIRSMLRKDQELRIRADQILDHPFVADVRTVKGYPVETITLHLHVTEPEPIEHFPHADQNAQVIIVPIEQAQPQGGAADPKKIALSQRGVQEMISFMSKEGPDFQIIRSGVYSATFYSIKSDPRRNKIRKQSVSTEGSFSSDATLVPKK